ncbi:MAG: DUF11 domain-containing protein [Armatimonadetes bacterium]|nr:DUF11 domain-containing protein [Armatimonadota bacterium]
MGVTKVSFVFGNQNNNGAADNGTVNPVLVNKAVNPGECVVFPLDLVNTGGQSDTHVLTYAIAGLPAEEQGRWTVALYVDADNEGALDNNELTPLTNTGVVKPYPVDPEKHLLARVCAPAGASAATRNVTFSAQSTNRPGEPPQTVTDSVTVKSTARLDLTPNRSGIGRPGSALWYDHVLQSYADYDLLESDLYFTVQGQNPRNDWSYTLYVWDGVNEATLTALPIQTGGPRDGQFRLGTGAGKLTADDGTPGSGTDQRQLRVRMFIPVNTPPNLTDVLNITVSNDANVGAGYPALTPDTVTDVTVVANSDLVLSKDNGGTFAINPGGEITYTTTFQNLGTDTLRDAVIMDAIPKKTEYRLGSAAAANAPPTNVTISAFYSLNWGTTWIADGGAGYVAATNVKWVLSLAGGGASDSLPSGAKGSVKFTVRVK